MTILTQDNVRLETERVEYGSRQEILERLTEQGTFKSYGYIKNEVRASPLVLFKQFLKMYGMDTNQSTAIGGDFANEISNDLDSAVQNIMKSVKRNSDLGELGLKCLEEDLRKLYPYILRGKDLINGYGVHASGVILSNDPLPVDLDHVLPFNGADIEALGYIKYDILSVNALDPVHRYGNVLDGEVQWQDCEIPLLPDGSFDKESDNWKVYKEVFWEGLTDTVFQFGSDGMKGILKSIKPTTLTELAEVNALYRPGPLGSGMVDDYLRMKRIERDGGVYKERNPEKSVLRDVLKSEFGSFHAGMMIFQEDVMRICQACSGFSSSEADDIRAAMGKKKFDKLKKYEQQFLDNWKYREYIKIGQKIYSLSHDEQISTNKGELLASELLQRSQTEVFEVDGRQVAPGSLSVLRSDPSKVWEFMKNFAEYAFNKSHAIAYSMVSFQTAYAFWKNQELILQDSLNSGKAGGLQALESGRVTTSIPKLSDGPVLLKTSHTITKRPGKSTARVSSEDSFKHVPPLLPLRRLRGYSMVPELEIKDLYDLIVSDYYGIAHVTMTGITESMKYANDREALYALVCELTDADKEILRSVRNEYSGDANDLLEILEFIASRREFRVRGLPSGEKYRVVHCDDGSIDFLGWHFKRREIEENGEVITATRGNYDLAAKFRPKVPLSERREWDKKYVKFEPELDCLSPAFDYDEMMSEGGEFGPAMRIINRRLERIKSLEDDGESRMAYRALSNLRSDIRYGGEPPRNAGEPREINFNSKSPADQGAFVKVCVVKNIFTTNWGTKITFKFKNGKTDFFRIRDLSRVPGSKFLKVGEIVTLKLRAEPYMNKESKVILDFRIEEIEQF